MILFDTNVLLDIGVHTELEGRTLVTRDAARARACFPKVPLITP